MEPTASVSTAAGRVQVTAGSPISFDSGKKGEGRLRRFVEWSPIEKFTGLLVLFTALMAICSLLQALAFIQSERSFLSVSAIEVKDEKPLTEGSPLIFESRISNSGRSTAFIVSANYTLVISDQPLPTDPSYVKGPSDILGPVVAGGNRQLTFSSSTDKGKTIILSKVHADGIASGTYHVYVFGYVKYKDEYSWFSNRITGFCYVYNPLGKSTSSQFDDCRSDHYIYARYGNPPPVAHGRPTGK